MLPRTITRRVGAQKAWRPASLARFQTTSAPAQNSASDVSKPAGNSSKAGPKGSKVAESAAVASGEATAAQTSDAKPQRRNKYPYNRKHHEIVNQVKKAVDGVAAAPDSQLNEAIDIFEEGAAYLREIQVAEGISEDALFSLFQPVSAKLFDLVLAAEAAGAAEGTRSAETLLDMMAQQRIAHTYHFLAVQKRELQAAADPQAFSKVLQTWITYLDYQKQMNAAGAGRLVRGAFGVYRDRNYQSADILNLAYFALITHCLRTGEEYDLATTTKILQVDDAAKIPPLYYVTLTLTRLGLRDVLQDELRAFYKKTSELDVKNMDPNGAPVARKLENYIKMGAAMPVRKLYAEMREALAKNSIAISEQTLGRVMHAFIELHFFDDALAIFAAMCQGLIAKPAAGSWELALKALGHPSNVLRMSDAQKKQTVEKVEALLRTMQALGVPVNAKVFGVFIGSLANLNRADLVEQYLQQYSHVPVVHMTRNNILVGLALNENLAAAELKMKEFLKADPSYTPSTSVMNTFLAHYVAESNDKAVEGILDFMTRRGIEENIATATTVLNYYFKTYRARGMVPNVHELLSEVIKDSGKWDQFMVATLIDGLVKDGVNMDAARAVFKYFCETRNRFKHSLGMMTSMIKAEMEFGSVHNAEELFDWYVKNLRNEAVMYNMMIRGLLMKRESLALKYYSDLCAQRPFNVAPNFYTYYFLLEHFRRKNDRTRIQWVLDEIAGANLTEFGKDLPRKIRDLSRDYQVSDDLLARLS